MNKYQMPSLSMIPRYRVEGNPNQTVMTWKEIGGIIERDLMRDGFEARVFLLEAQDEKIIFHPFF